MVIFDAEPWEEDAFSKLKQHHMIQFVHGPLTLREAQRHKDAVIISMLACCRVPSDILEQFPLLQLIATRSTGVDHIDLDYCARHGIMVVNVPGYASETVAEHVFGLLLLMSHHLFEAVARTRSGDFSEYGLRGFDLAGKVLGIIGMGSIGQGVARIAHGFGMEVIAFDVSPQPDLADKLSFSYRDLDSVLSTADVISLHVPAMSETKHLISSREI